MNYILFDTPQEHGNLLPLTFTRPVADLRVGIDTLRNKWEAMLPGEYSYMTEDYLAEKFPAHLTSDNIFIAGHLIATEALAAQIASLAPGEAIADEKEIWAYSGTTFTPGDTQPTHIATPCETPDAIRYAY
ncbi:MAG: glucose-1-phosphate thymidylyltransferase, partial [Bacteroidales bacterium]|nr:glucose-1-phosphate thymidylyltransferase [Bacteroidales bacterium]